MTEVWAKAKWPGDAVRNTYFHFSVDKDVGFVAVQHYENRVMVAAYLPGSFSDHPGDTPKMSPTMSTWFDATEVEKANKCFDDFCKRAIDAGWKEGLGYER